MKNKGYLLLSLISRFIDEEGKKEKVKQNKKRERERERNRIGKRILGPEEFCRFILFARVVFQNHLTHSSYDGFAHEDVSLCGPFCAYCWVRNSSGCPRLFLGGRCFPGILAGRGAKILYVFRIFRTLMKRKEARLTVPIRRFPSPFRIFSLLLRETTKSRLVTRFLFALTRLIKQALPSVRLLLLSLPFSSHEIAEESLSPLPFESKRNVVHSSENHSR